MVIVDEILIVGIGVDRLNMTAIDPEFIIDDFNTGAIAFVVQEAAVRILSSGCIS